MPWTASQTARKLGYTILSHTISLEATMEASSFAALASRFIKTDSVPWIDTGPGSKIKVIYSDPVTGLLTILGKLEPGAGIPAHVHEDLEQTYVLEGSLLCGEGECKAGEFVWRPAGSRHEAWAGAKGGLFLAMFQIPNKFFGRDGRETDFLGKDWQKVWGALR